MSEPISNNDSISPTDEKAKEKLGNLLANRETKEELINKNIMKGNTSFFRSKPDPH
jgi:hypothetical protein